MSYSNRDYQNYQNQMNYGWDNGYYKQLQQAQLNTPVPPTPAPAKRNTATVLAQTLSGAEIAVNISRSEAELALTLMNKPLVTRADFAPGTTVTWKSGEVVASSHTKFTVVSNSLRVMMRNRYKTIDTAGTEVWMVSQSNGETYSAEPERLVKL